MSCTEQKFKQITKAILFCFILILSSCENEDSSSNNLEMYQATKIMEAKNWFEDYKAKEDFHPIFSAINYHWDQATVVTLNDGSLAITVPITDINQNPEYKGEKILYLYPFGEDFDAVVYELIPDQKQVEANAGFQNLDSYNGYISTWDLKNGFIKGAKFENSIAVEDVTIKIVPTEEIKLRNSTSKLVQIDLDEVIIEGPGGGGSNFMDFSYVLSGGSFGSNNIGSNTGNYFYPPRGGSGGSGSSSTPTIDEVETIEDKIDDSELDPCLKAVMEKLKNATNADIASILAKLGANSLYKVTFVYGAASGRGADTKKTNPAVMYDYTITIDPNKNTTSTKLFKANMLLHELVHAYFFSLKDDSKTSGNSVFIDTPTLFKAYVDKSYNNTTDGDEHHTEMANRYVDAIAESLQEYQTDVAVTSGKALQEYKDLAWSGLTDTKVFDNLPENDRIRIKNRGNAESNGLYAGGLYAIGKPCN